MIGKCRQNDIDKDVMIPLPLFISCYIMVLCFSTSVTVASGMNMDMETLWHSLLDQEELLSSDNKDELLIKVTLLTSATMKLFTSKLISQQTTIVL